MDMEHEDSSNAVLPYIVTDDFDISKFSIEAPKPSKTMEAFEKKQYMFFPRYLFPDDEGEEAPGRCIFVTKPIKLTFGGIPRIHEEYRKTDKQCMLIWIPLSGDDDGANNLYEKVVVPMDEFLEESINNAGDNQTLISRFDPKKKVMQPMKLLKYISFVNEYVHDDDGDDTNNHSQNKPVMKRMKVDIATSWTGDDSKVGDIKTKVFIRDPRDPDSNLEVSVKSLDDMRQHLVWNCTAQFVLEFNKFWVSKEKDKSVGMKYKCGLKTKCLQLLITEKPSSSKIAGILKSNIFDLGNKVTSGKTVKNENKESKENKMTKPQKKSEDSDEEENNEDDENEEDDDKDVKATTKNNAKSSTSSTTKNNTNQKMPPTKSTKNIQKSSESSDDDSSSSSSESEDKPPVTKGKAPVTKGRNK